MANISGALERDLANLARNRNSGFLFPIIYGGHAPLPQPTPGTPVVCKYCGRSHPAGAVGVCQSCGGPLPVK